MRCAAAVLLLSVFIFSGCAGMSQPFTRDELALLAASTVAQAFDWNTTSQLGPTGNYEMNPILGRYPDQGVINDYFISSWLFRLVVAKALTHRYRKVWLASITFVSIGLVYNNCQIDGVGW